MTLIDQIDRAETPAPAVDVDGPTAEREVVEQFAHILRLQARMLEGEGDADHADLLRDHAARSERAVGLG